MGKSDSFIFNEYKEILLTLEKPSSIAFLGFSKSNHFTESLPCNVKHFYDITLGNWSINDDWKLQQKYDLIISTRCPYFSKKPLEFVEKCKSYLTEGGHALIDWGLGDHWRFEKFKVGWISDGEHEYAYHNQNFLYSTFWKDELSEDFEVQQFWNAVKLINPKYSSKTIGQVVREEVPSIVEYDTIKLKTKFLWPERPQLYIITLL